MNSRASILIRPGRAAGMTLIELIGVLAILAILAAVAVPPLVRRVDRAAWTRETGDLDAIANAYVQSTLRTKTIPGSATWVSAVANELALSPAAVATNSRSLARAFVIDTNLSLGGAGLPFTQNSNGLASPPVSARALWVSSLSRPLPVTSGLLSTTEFNALWNAPENTKPTSAAWSGWAGSGEDLRIRRLNMEPLFDQLLLINNDPTNTGRFSIDGSATMAVPTNGLGKSAYYLDGTLVGLHATNNSVVVRHLLKENISFVFDYGAWRAQLMTGNLSGTNASTASAFSTTAGFFQSAPWNSGALHGANQATVLYAMYTFMFEYTMWASGCPRFARRGATLAQVPEYEMLLDARTRLDEFSGNTGLLK